MQSNFKSDTSSERQRRWHAKVTSGCATCRRRRVKCDEQRPTCKRCSRLKLTCHGNGYGSDVATAVTSANETLEFHITTPDSYEHRRPFNHSSCQNAASTRSSLEAACTAPQQRRFGRDSTATVACLPSISSMLVAGTFDTWGTSYVTNASMTDRRNFDHAIYCQWSTFITNREQDMREVTSEFTSYALKDPVVWYTVIYAGASHRAYMSEAINSPTQDLTRIYLKSRAIGALEQALQNRNGEVTEGLLVSIVILSALGTGESVKREIQSKVQSRKTSVKSMGSEYYAAVDPSIEHLHILYKLIERRGGIQTILSRGVLMAIVLFDVWNSWKLLSRPGLPMLQPLSDVLKLRTWALDLNGKRLYRCLTESLTPMIAALDLPESAATLRVLEGLRILTSDFYQTRSTPNAESVLTAPDQSILIWLRCMVMHELLSLPDHTRQSLRLEHGSDQSILIYELCRVSCLMYTQVWLCAAVSKRKNMARELLSKMRPLLTASVVRLYDGNTVSSRYPEFFLWTLILSLMCAYEDLDVTGDSTSMQQTSVFLVHTQIEPVAESWPKIVNILETFLWAGFDCDLTGREAWEQGCSLSIKPTRQ